MKSISFTIKFNKLEVILLQEVYESRFDSCSLSNVIPGNPPSNGNFYYSGFRMSGKKHIRQLRGRAAVVPYFAVAVRCDWMRRTKLNNGKPFRAVSLCCKFPTHTKSALYTLLSGILSNKNKAMISFFVWLRIC
jgi:hypothetical protein